MMKRKDNLVYFPPMVEAYNENESQRREYAKMVEEQILQEKKRQVEELSHEFMMLQSKMTDDFANNFVKSFSEYVERRSGI